MKTKTHHMHRTHLIKRKLMRAKRAKREAFKAWMLPTRMFKESWRLTKLIAMLMIAPFVLVYFMYLLIFKKQSPVWDGG